MQRSSAAENLIRPFRKMQMSLLFAHFFELQSSSHIDLGCAFGPPKSFCRTTSVAAYIVSEPLGCCSSPPANSKKSPVGSFFEQHRYTSVRGNLSGYVGNVRVSRERERERGCTSVYVSFKR